MLLQELIDLLYRNNIEETSNKMIMAPSYPSFHHSPIMPVFVICNNNKDQHDGEEGVVENAEERDNNQNNQCTNNKILRSNPFPLFFEFVYPFILD